MAPIVDLFWPAFDGNGRADLLEKFQVTTLTDRPDDPTQWLYLCGPEGAARQVEMVGGAACERLDVQESKAMEYSHRYVWRRGMTPGVRPMLRLLKEVRTLRRYDEVDCALVLDWYKVPDDDVDPQQWPNTASGELIYRGKYYKTASVARQAARQTLVERLADVIDRHALYCGATAIVTVPGSAGDYKSFGEGLTGAVAAKVGKQVVMTTPKGAHAPRKEGAHEDLSDAFTLPTSVAGDVVIVDDVVRSGASMSAVALAARKAGAARVFGLAAVKTMRG